MLGGLFGSVGHCSVMCSPLVAAQMLRLDARGASTSYLWFYHAGRISIYMLLGVVAAVAGRLLFGGALAELSRTMVLAAGVVFLVSAFFPARTHRCCDSKRGGLMRRIERARWQPLQHYLRGVLMGFMPCGMLLSVLLLVSTLHQPAGAALVMLAFGLSTTPMLQLAGRLLLAAGRRHPQAGENIGRMAMGVNGMFLCGIGLNLVHTI